MQRSLRRVILCCWWIVFWLKKSMLNWTSLYKAQNNIYFRRIKLYTHPLKSHCNRTKYLENIEFLFFSKFQETFSYIVFRQRLTRKRLTPFLKALENFKIPKIFGQLRQNPQFFTKIIFGVTLILYRYRMWNLFHGL